jgi:hypothetical protein
MIICGEPFKNQSHSWYRQRVEQFCLRHDALGKLLKIERVKLIKRIMKRFRRSSCLIGEQDDFTTRQKKMRNNRLLTTEIYDLKARILYLEPKNMKVEKFRRTRALTPGLITTII